MWAGWSNAKKAEKVDARRDLYMYSAVNTQSTAQYIVISYCIQTNTYIIPALIEESGLPSCLMPPH